MTRALAVFLVPLLFVSTSASAAESYKRLLATLEKDSAYKVRMQAIRVLSKRIERSGERAPDEVVEALGLASNLDESYLVRGMAVVALGVLEDPRARPYLEGAQSDDEAFVRKQAKKALARTPKAAPPPPVAPPPPIAPPPSVGSKSLVIDAADHPDVETTPELREAMVALLSDGLKAKVAGSYRIDDGRGATGYRLTASLAERSSQPEGDEQRLTVLVRLTIATWPENNLRQVLSAKASAKTKSKSAKSIERLERKLLEAAMKRVVGDTMAQIGGG